MFWPSKPPARGSASRLVRACLRALLVLLVTSTFTGCKRYVRLDLQTSPCLNPPDQYCDESGTNSRVLEFKVYQLKEPVDIASLNWEELNTPDGDWPVLEPYLSDPTNKVLVKREFTVQRQERRTEKIRRLRKFKHLLVVTSGRHAQETSIAQTRIRTFQRWQSLCFEYYGASEPIDERSWLSRALKKKTSECVFTFEIEPGWEPPMGGEGGAPGDPAEPDAP